MYSVKVVRGDNFAYKSMMKDRVLVDSSGCEVLYEELNNYGEYSLVPMVHETQAAPSEVSPLETQTTASPLQSIALLLHNRKLQGGCRGSQQKKGRCVVSSLSHSIADWCVKRRVCGATKLSPRMNVCLVTPPTSPCDNPLALQQRTQHQRRVSHFCDFSILATHINSICINGVQHLFGAKNPGRLWCTRVQESAALLKACQLPCVGNPSLLSQEFLQSGGDRPLQRADSHVVGLYPVSHDCRAVNVCTVFTGRGGGEVHVGPLPLRAGEACGEGSSVRLPKKSVFCADLLRNTSKAAVGCSGGVSVIDLNRMKTCGNVHLGKNRDCTAICAVPFHDELFVHGTREGHFFLKDLRGGGMKFAAGSYVSSLKWSEGNIVSRCADTSLKMWDVRRGDVLKTFIAGRSAVHRPQSLVHIPSGWSQPYCLANNGADLKVFNLSCSTAAAPSMGGHGGSVLLNAVASIPMAGEASLLSSLVTFQIHKRHPVIWASIDDRLHTVCM